MLFLVSSFPEHDMNNNEKFKSDDILAFCTGFKKEEEKTFSPFHKLPT